MFDRWLMVDNSLCNVISETGHKEGFEFQIRIPYYRGIPLSIVEEITINAGMRGGIKRGSYAGDIFTNKDIRFTVAAGSFMMTEMETLDVNTRWNFDEAATLRVNAPGGVVGQGAIDIEMEILLRVSYLRFAARARKVFYIGKDKYLSLAQGGVA